MIITFEQNNFTKKILDNLWIISKKELETIYIYGRVCIFPKINQDYSFSWKFS